MTIGGIVHTVELFLNGSWVDLGADPQSIEITRGRDDDLATTPMGKCTVRLHDHTGKYSAVKTTSPLYPYLRPRVLGRVRAVYSAVTYGQFYGFLERCETNPDYGAQLATMELADLFTRLGSVAPTLTSAGATTTGAAIGRILDDLGWTDPTMRDLDTGDDIPDFSADGSTSGLALIEGLLETERGQFFVNGSGVATYENRHARSQGARATSQATITGTMQAVSPGLDIATLRNRATVTRAGGAAQTYTDSASATEFDPIPFGAITSPYLATDAQALSLGTYMVSRRKDPLPTARRLRLVAAEPSVRVPMLQRDLGDRVTVTSALTGISADYHIERIAQSIDVAGMQLETTWTLSARSVTNQPFLIGISGVGSTTDLLTY